MAINAVPNADAEEPGKELFGMNYFQSERFQQFKPFSQEQPFPNSVDQKRRGKRKRVCTSFK